jgi:hypothetical protein
VETSFMSTKKSHENTPAKKLQEAS